MVVEDAGTTASSRVLESLTDVNRSRSVKCDETRPACLVCEKLGQPCPGYPQRASVFQSYQDLKDTVESAAATEDCTKVRPADLQEQSLIFTCGAINSPPGIWNVSDVEARAIQFFHEKTKSELQAFNSAAVYFFDSLVPQLALTVPTIKHQLAALGTFHEGYLHAGIARSKHRILAEQQYGVALRTFRQTISKSDAYVVLALCVLFVATSMLQENFDAAYQHLKCGLAYLQDAQLSSNTTEKAVIEKFIQPLFAHLSFVASRSYLADIKNLPELKWGRLVIPFTFRYVKEAWAKFFEVSQTCQFEGSSIAAGPSEAWDVWESWHACLQRFLPTLEGGPERARLQAHLLNLWYEMYRTTALCQMSDNEMIYDDYLEEHRRQYALCEEICHSPYTYRLNEPDEGDYDISPGVYGPLWLIACCCRDPVLRRKACRLFDVHHSRCGHTDTCMGAYASIIIEMEEAQVSEVRSCQDVPMEHRVRVHGTNYSEPPWAKVEISRWPHLVVESVAGKADFDMTRQAKFTKIVPIEYGMRITAYQGLMRLRASSCCCKSHGANLA